MHNSDHLTYTEKRLDYIFDGMDDATVRGLARLGLLLVITEGEMSIEARDAMNDRLSTVGPDYLLAFRALRVAARQAMRPKRNWRSRT